MPYDFSPFPRYPRYSDYRRYRDFLRRDFQFRCAYCLVHEHYFLDGEGGEIDHFRPLHPPDYVTADFSPLKTVYRNLYWTCSTCNMTKGNLWPSDFEYQQQLRFLDPCAEDHDEHWRSLPDGTLDNMTPTGWYTIRALRLNRPRLIRHRQMLRECQAKMAMLERKLARKRLSSELRAVWEEQILLLKSRIQPPVFL